MTEHESNADDANGTNSQTMTTEDGTEIPERFLKDGREVQMGERDDALIDESEVEREWIQVLEEDPETGEETSTLYWFDMRECSWEKKTDILDQNLDTDERTESVDLDMKGYYRDMMEFVIEDKSVEGSLSIFLKGMSSKVGDQLQERVPQPGTMMSDVDEGKSEESSEAE